jgi:hypothetical protein
MLIALSLVVFALLFVPSTIALVAAEYFGRDYDHYKRDNLYMGVLQGCYLMILLAILTYFLGVMVPLFAAYVLASFRGY